VIRGRWDLARPVPVRRVLTGQFDLQRLVECAAPGRQCGVYLLPLLLGPLAGVLLGHRAGGGLRLSGRLPGRQFARTRFVDRLAVVLAEPVADVADDRVGVERHVDLRDLVHRLAVDQFGFGGGLGGGHVGPGILVGVGCSCGR
jgi:hypothetical protein